jgi:hypothetical protein
MHISENLDIGLPPAFFVTDALSFIVEERLAQVNRRRSRCRGRRDVALRFAAHTVMKFAQPPRRDIAKAPCVGLTWNNPYIAPMQEGIAVEPALTLWVLSAHQMRSGGVSQHES